MSRRKSPRVTHVSWGRMEVEGLGSGKDFVLFPGGGREWDWTVTGTRHDPGIQPADVEELLHHGATVVVLGRGMHRMLQVAPETVRFLEASHVEVHATETRAAVELYNRLTRTAPVGALFHSTC